MPYRAANEECPRCGLALVDARSARGCRSCGGLWVGEAVLTEMIVAMLPPRPLSRLVLAVLDRADRPIPCPTCKTAMEPTTIHEVSLDRCPERHGVWFDAEELQVALRRVAEPGREPPLVELPWKPLHRSRPVERRLRAEAPSPTPPPALAPVVTEHAPELAFVIQEPDQPPRALRLRQNVIKVGKLGSLAGGHLQLVDGTVSRLHAVIEAQPPAEVAIIDLGSSAGTFVNGEPVARRTLRSGDRLALGDTLIDVTIVPVA